MAECGSSQVQLLIRRLVIMMEVFYFSQSLQTYNQSLFLTLFTINMLFSACIMQLKVLFRLPDFKSYNFDFLRSLKDHIQGWNLYGRIWSSSPDTSLSVSHLMVGEDGGQSDLSLKNYGLRLLSKKPKYVCDIQQNLLVANVYFVSIAMSVSAYNNLISA